MSTMDPVGDGGGGPESTTQAASTTTTTTTPVTSVEQTASPSTPITTTSGAPTPGAQQHQQYPPPSPLSGCYLFVVLPEPHTAQHKDLILNRLAKGFLSWDKDSCHVDLEKELQALVAQAPEGEEARNGERLIQYATENLVTEVLIHPQTNTLLQCIRNLLASFTKHRHIIHAGYTFGENGSWILQDGTFSLADFLDAFSEHEVQRVLRAYENSVTVDIHCASVGDWTTNRLSKEACTRSCRVRVNPDDVLTAGVPSITSFSNYIGQYLIPQTLDQLMEPSDVVGNIRFSHPTLYVFPGGQGDAALFGINGFNMLVDGGFARKACFWDFTRHLDRLDAVLVTRLNNSNIGGMSSVLRKKKEMYVYPQIGHFFCNLVERRQSNSPDGDKDIDPLVLNLTDIGQEMMFNLRHINLRAHQCYRDPEPINLYHKVGHGTLDMYVLSPSKDSREVRDFLSKWHTSDSKLFTGSHKKDSNNLSFPIQNLVSICALLVWQPANPEDTITRILFPGSTPQHKIFEGFERLKHLDFLKHPVCSAKSLSPSTSLAALRDKPVKQKLFIDKETKKVTEMKREKKESDLKAAKLNEDAPQKTVGQPSPIIPTGKPQSQKIETKARKITENKKVESESRESKKIEKELKEIKKETRKESSKIEKSEKRDEEIKKTDVIKPEAEKTVPTKEPKLKPEIKKKETKEIKTAKPAKVEPHTKPKPIEKKMKPLSEKKDVKSSPTTPKKTLNGVATKLEMSKTVSKPKPMSKTSSVAPAKSAKEANNRKVVEQKNIEMSTIKETTPTSKSAPKPKAIERKPISRKPKPISPSKAKVPGSPAKSTRSTPTASVKSDKDGVIRKVKGDKGTTDSSTVSTPSGVDAESAAKLAEKSLTEKSEDMSLDSIESKVLADLKEEREVSEEIEAVFKKAEAEEMRKEDRLEGDDEITAEAIDKKEEDVTEEDITAEIEDVPKIEGSRKGSQELTEEDEYLIVEKEEVYTEDSVQSGEEQKHVLDEAESEKVKALKDLEGAKDVDEGDESEEKGKDETPEKKYIGADKVEDKKLKSPVALSGERKESLEEVKEMTSSPVEAMIKTEEKDDSGKKDSEDITKEPSSISPDKLDSSEKKTDTDVKQDLDLKEQVVDKLEESQERISTLESGATTTAPTLPEDERIPLDEIKEDIDEKHVVEDVKEKDVPSKDKEEVVEKLPQAAVKPDVKVFDVRQTVQGIQRDIVKTPDEVADLPVHEEVDPKLYRMDDFEKDKDEKQPQSNKESPTPAKEQKGVFGFFGKVADKFEKGIDKLTKKSRRDSEKDVDDKSSSKSSSPKDPKAPGKAAFEEVDMDKVFVKVTKPAEKVHVFEEIEPKITDVKTAAIKDTMSFIQAEISDTKRRSICDLEVKIADKVEEIPEIEEAVQSIDASKDSSPIQEKDSEKKGDLQKDDDTGEDAEDVKALLEEASKKFKTVKDSLRDSLESLEDKIADGVIDHTPDHHSAEDVVKGTLEGVAEKLEEIIPHIEGVIPASTETDKVKFDIPKDEEFEKEYEGEGIEHSSLGKGIKDVVREVGGVLAGTAGILIEDSSRDIEKIEKKIEESSVTEITSRKSSIIAEQDEKPIEIKHEDMILPKKVGVTEEFSIQEEVEELHTKPVSYSRPEEVEVHEEPCVKATKEKDDTMLPVHDGKKDKEEALKICADIMKEEDYVSRTKRSITEIDSSKYDVLSAGVEEVCVKKIVERKYSTTEESEDEIVEPKISLETKASPSKAEVVMVTPGSTPTSPKFTTEKPYEEALSSDIDKYITQSKLPDDIKSILNKEYDTHKIIEELIITKKKITTEIIEYITVIKRIPKTQVIYIIEEIIVRRGLPRENVVENIKILESEESISPQEKIEIENYIFDEFITKNKKITVQIIEEISRTKMLPARILIQIIEEIIIKKKILRHSLLDISDAELIKLNQTVFKQEQDSSDDFANSKDKRLSTVKVDDIEIPEVGEDVDEDNLVDGFVNIPSEAEMQDKRRSSQICDIDHESTSVDKDHDKDDFEAVEQEYKVEDVMVKPLDTTHLTDHKKDDKLTHESIVKEEEDVSEVSEAHEKSTQENISKEHDEEKEIKESAVITETEALSMSETADTIEKYLDEAKEKSVDPTRITDEKTDATIDHSKSAKEEVSKQLEDAKITGTQLADATGRALPTSLSEVTESHSEIRKETISKLPSPLLSKLGDDGAKDGSTVHRMLVTASSEDGGHETEICPTGTITFSKSGTPDDSLKDISTKSTPEKDSLHLDKDSLQSVGSTPEKDSISDKSEIKGFDKVTSEDSLDKSPKSKRSSQYFEDSLEKSELPTLKESTTDETHKEISERRESISKSEAKSPTEKHDYDVHKSRSSSISEDKASVKTSRAGSLAGDKTPVDIGTDKPRSMSIAEEKEISIASDTAEKIVTRSRSSSIASDKSEKKHAEKDSELDEKLPISTASMIDETKLYKSKSPSPTLERIEEKELEEKILHQSRSSSITGEEQKRKSSVSLTKLQDEISDKSDITSRKSSIAKEELISEQKKDKSPSEIGDQDSEKITGEADCLKISSALSDKSVDHSKSPTETKEISDLTQAVDEYNKSDLISVLSKDRKDGGVGEESESLNISTKKADLESATDRSKSPSITNEKQDIEELDSEVGSHKSPSVSEEKSDLKDSSISPTSVRSKSPIVDDEKLKSKEASPSIDRSKSPDESDRKLSVKGASPSSDRSKSPVEKIGDLETSRSPSVDFSKSPIKSTIDEKPDLRDLSPSTDHSKSPDKSDEKSEVRDSSVSVISSKSLNVTDMKDTVLSPSSDHSKSPSVVSEKPDLKDLTTSPSSVHSKSPSISGDQLDQKDVSESQLSSRSKSPANDEILTLDDGVSSPKIDTKLETKDKPVSPIGDHSKTPSISGEKPELKDVSDGSKSPTYSGEKINLKDGSPLSSRSKSPSIAGETVDLKDDIISAVTDHPLISDHEKDRSSRVGSIIPEEHPTDKSRSGSIATGEHSVVRSRAGSIVVEEDKTDKSRSASLVEQPDSRSRSGSVVHEEHPPARSRTGSIIAEEHISDKSRSASIIGEEQPGVKSRSGSIIPGEHSPTRSRTGSIIVEEDKTGKSRSASVVAEEQPDSRSRSGSVVHEEHPPARSRTGSVIAEEHVSDKSRSASIIGEEQPGVKSRSGSVVPEDHSPTRSRTGIIIVEEEKTGKSRSASVVAEEQPDSRSRSGSVVHEEHPPARSRTGSVIAEEHISDKSRSESLVEQPDSRSRSGSVVHEEHPSARSRTGSVIAEEHISDKSRSASIIGEEQPGVKSRSGSVVPEDHSPTRSRTGSIIVEEDKTGKSRSASVVAEEQPDSRSRSGSVVHEEHPPARSRTGSVIAEEHISDKSRSASIIGEEQLGVKSRSGSVVPEDHSPTRSRTGSIIVEEEKTGKSRSASVVAEEQPDSRSRSGSVVHEEHPPARSRTGSVIAEEHISDKSRSESLVEQPDSRSRSGSVVHEEHPPARSRTGSVIAEEHISDKSRSASIIGEEQPGVKSRSGSVVPEDHSPTRSRTGSIIVEEDKTGKSRSASVVAEEQPDSRSRSGSVVHEEHPPARSRTGSVIAEEHISDKSRSASIIGEEQPGVKSRSGSVVPEDPSPTRSRTGSVIADEKTTDKSRSASVVGIEQADSRSRSGSVVPDEHLAARSRTGSIIVEDDKTGKSSSASLVGVEQPDIETRSESIVSDIEHKKSEESELPSSDKSVIDRSRSSSIAPDEHLTSRSRSSSKMSTEGFKLDITKSTVHIGDEIAATSKPSSVVPDEEIDHDEEKHKSRSASVVSISDGQKISVHEGDKSKSPSIASDKADVEEVIDDIIEKSRTLSMSSIHSEPKEAVDISKSQSSEKLEHSVAKSPSPDVEDQKISQIKGSSSTKSEAQIDKSRSASVSIDEEYRKTLEEQLIEKSRSSSIASVIADQKGEVEEFLEKQSKSRSISITSIPEDHKSVISKTQDISESKKSPSLIIETLGTEESVTGKDTSRSPSIASETKDLHEVLSDKSKSPSVSDDKISTKETFEDAMDKSQASSTTSEKHVTKELSPEPVSHLIHDGHKNLEDSYKSSSDHEKEPFDKMKDISPTIDAIRDFEHPRSLSIISDKSERDVSPTQEAERAGSKDVSKPTSPKPEIDAEALLQKHSSSDHIPSIEITPQEDTVRKDSLSREEVISRDTEKIDSRKSSRTSDILFEQSELDRSMIELTVEKKNEIRNHILNEYITKKRKITTVVIEEIIMIFTVPKFVIMDIVNEIIRNQNLSRQSVLDDIDDDENDEPFDLPPQKRIDIEKYIVETFISKNKKITPTELEEMAISNIIPRYVLISIIEEISVKRKIPTESLVDQSILDSRIDLTEPEESKKELSKQDELTTKEKSDSQETSSESRKTSIDSKISIKEHDKSQKDKEKTSRSPSMSPEPIPSDKSTQDSPIRSEPHIDEEISISEEKRTEVEKLLDDEYIKKGKKITLIVLEEIIMRTSLPRHIILEIIDEIIYKKNLLRREVTDIEIDEECDDGEMVEPSSTRSSQGSSRKSSIDYKSSEYIETDNESTRKSTSDYPMDYESQFHKAFVGGITEIRTTHITTLSGKTTPDHSTHDKTLDSAPEVIGSTAEKTERQTIPLKETKISEIVTESETTEKMESGSAEPEIVTKIIKREIVTEEEPEIITKIIRREIIEDQDPEIITKVIKREIIIPDDGDLTSTIEHELAKQMISGEEIPDVIETITTKTTKTIVTEESPSTKLITGEGETSGAHADSRKSSTDVLDFGKIKRMSISGFTDEHDSASETIKSADVKTTVTTVTTVTSSNGKVTTTMDIKERTDTVDGDQLEELIQSSQAGTRASIDSKSADTSFVERISGAQSDSKKDVSDNIFERMEHPLVRDLVSDDKSYSGKSSPDMSLPKDIVYGTSPSRSTPDIPMSPIIRDSALMQSHLSGRSTPDRKSEGRSATATPEGFRSSEVTRTTITKTRTISEEGEIITTIKEVTESTNEKGETIILAEKTKVEIDDRLPVQDVSYVRSGDDDPPPSYTTASSTKHDTGETQDAPIEFSTAAMSSSFYGELPAVPPQVSSLKTTEPIPIQGDFTFKRFTVEKELVGYEKADSKKYVDDADLDFDKALMDGGEMKESAGSFSGDVVRRSSQSEDKDDKKDDSKKDTLHDWGSPLGLPSPTPPRKFNLKRPEQPSTVNESTLDTLNFDVISDWGEPLHLPSPAPVANENSERGAPGTPKKDKKQTKKVISENIKNKKRSESPGRNEKKAKDSKNKLQPVYMDLTYVPHHGNSYYTSLEFFKKVRARYYVFSGTEPSREVYDALLDAKKTWEDKDLEVTMIPTYDTDTLGYWVADNEEVLAANHIDLSPSASRCTINLQDHETSCSAYRLEF